MSVVYSAVRRLDPACDDDWDQYLAWSGLSQLRELVSLDGLLCPSVFGDLTLEDWAHNFHEDFKVHLFYDLDHLQRKTSGNKRVNVLAILAP